MAVPVVYVTVRFFGRPVAYELVLYLVAMAAGRLALRDKTAATMA